MPNASSLPVAPWRAGLAGARANLKPGLVLQAFALALVGGYYWVPGVAEALANLTALRDRLGLSYSILSTALFGGFIPWLVLKLSPATRDRYTGRQGLGLTGFWALKGIELHLLYAGLAVFIGTDNSVATIVKKTLFDQFVYCPLLAVPGMWIGYQWIEHQFNFGPVWARFRARGWYAREQVPILIANFGVWAPTCAILYSLPTPLQLPLQNIVLCFFTLMMAHLSKTAR
jgi:hypothetical protein